MKNLSYLLLSISLFFIVCKDDCETTICYHDGVCIEGVCDCPEGFTGDSCEIEKPDCGTLTGTTWAVDYYYEWQIFEEYVSAFEYNWQFLHNDSVSIESDYTYETSMLGEGQYHYTLIGEDSINIGGMIYTYSFNDSHLHLNVDTVTHYEFMCSE